MQHLTRDPGIFSWQQRPPPSAFLGLRVWGPATGRIHLQPAPSRGWDMHPGGAEMQPPLGRGSASFPLTLPAPTQTWGLPSSPGPRGSCLASAALPVP